MKPNANALHTKLEGTLTRKELDWHHEEYCPAEQGFDWQVGKPIAVSPGVYEDMLEAFLQRDPGADDWPGENFLVLVGGIGTGKSTALLRARNRVLNTPRKCSLCSTVECSLVPKVIIFDFDSWNPSGDVFVQTLHKEEEEFWNYVAARLSTANDITMSPEEEVVQFWSWLLTKETLLSHSFYIHRSLRALSSHIHAARQGASLAGWNPAAVLNVLIDQRTVIINKMTSEDLAWYTAYTLIYTSERAVKPCPCRYLVLDNIDQAGPTIQKKAVDFVFNLGRLLQARTVIPIRPLTWIRGMGANQLIRVENHIGPALEKVLLRRIKTAIEEKHLAPEESEYLLELARIFTDERAYRLTTEMFRATSGLSVRWALRNFENMLQSPLLGPPSAGGIPIHNLRISQVARAYFWGLNQSISQHCFENLYQVDGDRRVEYRLVKSRVLDILHRTGRGSSSVGELLETLLAFNYPEEVVVQAINELMYNTRPLLWSEVGLRFERAHPHGRISLTPIGNSYYETLFGELYYEEVCLARSITDDVTLEEVYGSHIDFVARDLVEIKQAMEAGGKTYLKFYSQEDCALSLVHWAHLKEGIMKRTDPTPSWFDPAREHKIKEDVSQIVRHA